MVVILLKHLGVRVLVSQSQDGSNLNVIVKFSEKLSGEQRQQIMSSISANSLCKRGCPKRERIEVTSLLEAIGMDIEGAALDELSSELSSNSTSDPCAGLYGYYRVSCLYDVKMKGIAKEDVNVHKLMQTHDDASVVKRSFVESLRADRLASSSAPSLFSRRAHLTLLDALLASFVAITTIMISV